MIAKKKARLSSQVWAGTVGNAALASVAESVGVVAAELVTEKDARRFSTFSPKGKAYS